MVDRKTTPRPPRDGGNRQTPANNDNSIGYSEGKRGGLDVSPTRPAPAPRRPDRGQGEDEG